MGVRHSLSHSSISHAVVRIRGCELDVPVTDQACLRLSVTADYCVTVGSRVPPSASGHSASARGSADSHNPGITAFELPLLSLLPATLGRTSHVRRVCL